jgi:flagellar biogenesis protein FliO
MEHWREAAALATVFGLLGAAVWTLRRRAGGLRAGVSKSLTAVERVALTPQHTLHLIRISRRELLVATHPQGCTVLMDQPPPEAPGTVSPGGVS